MTTHALRQQLRSVLPAPGSTGGIMRWVLLALAPGIAAMTTVWGMGVLWNVLGLSLICIVTEAAALMLRGIREPRQLRHHLLDSSALVTAWLIAIAMPPSVPLGVLLLAGIAAIGLAKHAYGGLGRNVFNPAMVGYAIALISFPAELAAWPTLAAGTAASDVDTLSGATLLSEFRYRDGLTVAEFNQQLAGAVSTTQWIPWAFATGGALLVAMRLIAWRVPAAVIAGVALAALFGYDSGSSQSLGSLGFHLTSGGLLAAAFFVATDPVTHPNKPIHQLWFGLVVGISIYLIRAYGVQPDGIAFAILLGNCVTPLLNRHAITQPGTVQAHD